MELENQSAINSRHKSCPIKADQSSIAWIKFITPSSSFGPSLAWLVLESAKISWISPLSASLIFLDLTLVIGLTGTCKDPWMLCNSHQVSSQLLVKFISLASPTHVSARKKAVGSCTRMKLSTSWTMRRFLSPCTFQNKRLIVLNGVSSHHRLI